MHNAGIRLAKSKSSYPLVVPRTGFQDRGSPAQGSSDWSTQTGGTQTGIPRPGILRLGVPILGGLKTGVPRSLKQGLHKGCTSLTQSLQKADICLQKWRHLSNSHLYINLVTLNFEACSGGAISLLVIFTNWDPRPGSPRPGVIPQTKESPDRGSPQPTSPDL